MFFFYFFFFPRSHLLRVKGYPLLRRTRELNKFLPASVRPRATRALNRASTCVRGVSVSRARYDCRLFENRLRSRCDFILVTAGLFTLTVVFSVNILPIPEYGSSGQMNTFISNSAFLVIRSRGIAQQYDVQYQVFLLMWYRMILYLFFRVLTNAVASYECLVQLSFFNSSRMFKVLGAQQPAQVRAHLYFQFFDFRAVLRCASRYFTASGWRFIFFFSKCSRMYALGTFTWVSIPPSIISGTLPSKVIRTG